MQVDLIKRRKRMAARAIEVQDAVNPSAVGHLLMDAFALLNDEGADTYTKCEDPIVHIIISKLADLCRVGDFSAFSIAYAQCKKLAS